MSKTIIKLTEQDIHKIIKESVERILKEGMIDGYDDGVELLNTAWENLWSQFDRKNPAINWKAYEAYKGNPQKIKQWFDKYHIDFNDYL